MKITKNAVLGLIAVLLSITPPAKAARSKSQAKLKTVNSGRLIKEGIAEMENRRYDSAIQALGAAAKADRKNSEAFFLLGYAHYQRGFRGGNPETADKRDALETVRAYTTALNLDPGLKAIQAPYRLHHSMAMSYEALGYDDKAIDSYRTAFQLAPHNPILPLYAARLRYRLNEIGKSANNLAISLKRAREQNKVDAVVEMIKTNSYFSPMLKSPVHARILAAYDPSMAVAALDVDQGDTLRDAVRDTPGDQRKSIIAEKPQDAAVMKQVGVADDAFNYRHYREAIDGYNRALSLNRGAGALNSTQLSLIYERMGTSFNRLGLSESAIKSLQYSLQEMPYNASAHYQIALAYSVSGKFTNSLRALGEALKNAPSKGELRKMVLLAKTDAELDGMRDTAGFRTVLGPYTAPLQAMR